MSAIGSLVFCTDCGNLLDGSSGDEKAILTCEVCGTENTGLISLMEPGESFHTGSLSPHRYLIQDYYNQVQTHRFSLCTEVEAFDCSNADGRGCPDRGDHSANMSRMREGRDEILHFAVKECG